MNTAYDNLDDYEERLRRSSVRAKALKLGVVLLIAAAFVGFKVFKLVHVLGHTRADAAAVVRVSDDGSLHIDGCSKRIDACLADASDGIHTRGNHGSYECLVVPSAASPDTAQSDAMRACLRAGLSPSFLPRGAKW